MRTWKEGECLVFDDSFEHEVWHDGKGDRIVLICDMWHPELDLERDIIPTLTEDEKAAVAAARSGKQVSTLFQALLCPSTMEGEETRYEKWARLGETGL